MSPASGPGSATRTRRRAPPSSSSPRPTRGALLRHDGGAVDVAAERKTTVVLYPARALGVGYLSPCDRCSAVDVVVITRRLDTTKPPVPPSADHPSARTDLLILSSSSPSSSSSDRSPSTMAKKTTVVLFPGVGVGHLTPMLELANAFLRHAGGDTLDVAVALVKPPVMDTGFAATLARAQSTNTAITFHVLPPPPPPPTSGEPPPPETEEEAFTRMLGFLRAANAPLRDLLRSLPSAKALVLDMFCADALDVAAELAIPAYFFFPSGAAGLAVFLALPSTRAATFAAAASTVLTFHAAPPLKVADLPQGLDAMLAVADRMPDARGILVNSFDSLEPDAMRALRDGLCLPPHRPTPPVYCVGPLVFPGSGGGEEEHECLRWMDTQPDRSVVFLCFGSMGAFTNTQLAEIAAGFENSGERFLWVIRSSSTAPPGAGEPRDGGGDLDAVLPVGFRERTEGRGLVLRQWAPQLAVLRHRAAGAFVTHCGWNSTLEGVAAGLPLLCWPLYAEQRMNRVRIVEDMGLGVEVAMDDDGKVEAEEVEKKVRWVMGESDEARKLRERAAAARERAAEAVEDGGPSDVAFGEFLKDLFEACQGKN
ncbi:hypothetical protein HU200_014920 [Digitaria exilis]|uniref:Glycosyltransferase n=1 Tax=Digitaria exilis TaxID=1010633 RepID=A0A835KJR2_9POAL|nr:hypothetical protein HU200_014920 [Digitaria exilis]